MDTHIHTNLIITLVVFSPDTSLPGYIQAFIPSTLPRCTHTQTHISYEDMPPKLFLSKPHSVIHRLTYIPKYIHTQIHNQNSHSTPFRYNLVHTLPPKYTCALTNPSLDTLTFKHAPPKYTPLLSHTQPRCTPTSSGYTHSHPQYTHTHPWSN